MVLGGKLHSSHLYSRGISCTRNWNTTVSQRYVTTDDQSVGCLQIYLNYEYILRFSPYRAVIALQAGYKTSQLR
jgi:hypothetical protein